jgi:Uma2 family endonuclease
MAMPARPSYYTAEMVREFPNDGNRYEVVYGELLVTPAPRLGHQELVGRLYRYLGDYLRREPVGHVLFSPADISWDATTLVQPDLFVAALEEVRTMTWAKVQTLLLVVEILSPTTAWHDRFTKRKRYQEAGVPAYWIVDEAALAVEQWTPALQFPEIAQEWVSWHPAGASAPFSVELEELFRPL